MMDQYDVLFVLFGFGAILFLLSLWFSRKDLGKRERFKDIFLVTNRNTGFFSAGFSIASTWIWAPALFISAQKAYEQGIVGFMWFFIPNVLCLIIFAFFAEKLRNQMPQGYTLTEYIRKRFSSRVHSLYLIQFLVLQICSFAVQLLAGGFVLNWLTGIDFWIITIFLALLALSYALLSGMKASVLTDFVQMLIIVFVGGGIILWTVIEADGLNTVLKGIGGVSRQYNHFFNTDGIEVMVTFGIINAVGLLSGPFGDQTFWQRTFSIKKPSVKSSFFLGAFLFAIVPLAFSLLGFIASGLSLSIENPQLINIYTIQSLLPSWVLLPFVVVLLSGLLSTLDSNLCAISSILSVDFGERLYHKKLNAKETLNLSRISMIALAICGILIANIPKLTILYLFLFYGTLRATTLLPTILTILNTKIVERGVFFGLLLSFFLGIPLFILGKLLGSWQMELLGSLLTVLLSGITAWAYSYYYNHRKPYLKQEIPITESSKKI